MGNHRESETSYPAQDIGAKSPRMWTLAISLLVIVSVVSPFLFGIPVLGNYMAMDANFAIQLVGSPGFYFYGRLPYLIVALFAVVLHVRSSVALALGFLLFRIFAFYSCRAWLKGHVSVLAADCGALVFVGLPYAMSYNPIGRVGFAETAATALIPLLLLQMDRSGRSWRAAGQCAVILAVLYAALAATQLPQTLLAIASVTVYGFFRAGGRGVLVNLAGAVCGLLLSAPNILPAMSMQQLINPLAWTSSVTGDVRSQFLFSVSRYHLYHFLSQELYLYGTWFLCAAALVPFFFAPTLRARWRNPSSRAMLWSLTVCLLAMTQLFWPLWVYVPQFRALQFPWRLFPSAMAFAAGVSAYLVGRNNDVRKLCLVLVGAVIAVQGAVSIAGGWVSLSHRPATFPTVFINERLPHFVPWSQRDLPAYAVRRSCVPEYIPAAAVEAGWHLDGAQSHLLSATGEPPRLTVQTSLPVHVSQGPDGAFHIRGNLSTPASLRLPTFFFPDEQVLGSAGAAIKPDAGSGLTLVSLPRGPFTIQVDHERRTRSEVESYLASSAGGVMLLAISGLSLFGHRSSRMKNSRSGKQAEH